MRGGGAWAVVGGAGSVRRCKTPHGLHGVLAATAPCFGRASASRVLLRLGSGDVGCRGGSVSRRKRHGLILEALGVAPRPPPRSALPSLAASDDAAWGEQALSTRCKCATSRPQPRNARSTRRGVFPARPDLGAFPFRPTPAVENRCQTPLWRNHGDRIGQMGHPADVTPPAPEGTTTEGTEPPNSSAGLIACAGSRPPPRRIPPTRRYPSVNTKPGAQRPARPQAGAVGDETLREAALGRRAVARDARVDLKAEPTLPGDEHACRRDRAHDPAVARLEPVARGVVEHLDRRADPHTRADPRGKLNGTGSVHTVVIERPRSRRDPPFEAGGTAPMA